jgi:hypothetical protein
MCRGFESLADAVPVTENWKVRRSQRLRVVILEDLHWQQRAGVTAARMAA